MNNLLKALSQHAIQSVMITKLGLLKSGKLTTDGDRTEQPVVIPQREISPQQFIIGNDETESELSVESRSFLNRVNDQVRKRQETFFDGYYRKRRKTFFDMENVHVCNVGISSIHWKEIPGQLSFHHKYE